jgi:hypothetical protein
MSGRREVAKIVEEREGPELLPVQQYDIVAVCTCAVVIVVELDGEGVRVESRLV